MQINISTRHGQLSTSTQQKISDKVAKLTRFHERLTAAVITVDLNGEDRAVVEIQVTAEKAGRFVASDDSGSLMTSIDATLRRLEQQLKKHKEKVTNHRNAGRRASLESESEPTTPGSASSD